MNYKIKILLGVVVAVFVLVGAGIYYQIKQEEAKQVLNGTKTADAQKKDKSIVADDSQNEEIIFVKKFAKTYIEREFEVKYITEQKEELTSMMSENALETSKILNTLDDYKKEAELWEKSKTLNTMTSIDRSNRDVDKTEVKKDGNKYYITITYHTTNLITKITSGDEMKVENLVKGLVITVDDGKVSSVVEQG
jgi:hypothetical protein